MQPKERRYQLASPKDAQAIAKMSRDEIEKGLGWRWRPRRVLAHIKSPTSLVLTAKDKKQRLLGFAIMSLKFLTRDLAQGTESNAHILLLAVTPKARRQGIATALLEWLEACARQAGASAILLEVLADNQAAQRFYKTQQFCVLQMMPYYYEGRASGLRMRKRLVTPTPPTGDALSQHLRRLLTNHQTQHEQKMTRFALELTGRQHELWQARVVARPVRSLGTLSREWGIPIETLRREEAALHKAFHKALP